MEPWQSQIMDMKGFTDADEDRYAKILLTSFCLTVPTYAWFGFVDGAVPLWVFVPIMVGGGFMGFILGGVYLLLYGGILRFISRGLTAAVFYFVWKPRMRLALLALLLIGTAGLALSPVYLPPTLRTVERMNILRLASHFPFLN